MTVTWSEVGWSPGGTGGGCALFDDEDKLIICNDRYRELNKGVQEFINPGVHWETLLREMAQKGQSFYGRFGPDAKAA